MILVVLVIDQYCQQNLPLIFLTSKTGFRYETNSNVSFRYRF
jgi:hypothetical protein